MRREKIFMVKIKNVYKLMTISHNNLCSVGFRPQQGVRDFRATYFVMESRVLWWMMFGEDVFYPSPGVFHFPLVRAEDAPHNVLFFIQRPIRVWEDEESDESYGI